MNVYVTRKSVTAGDDVYAPHTETFTFPDGTSLEQVIGGIAERDYLPKIIGGKATWSVASNIPVAIVAQQWDVPRMLSLFESEMEKMDHAGGMLRLHFNYHAQIDPEIVYNIFWGFRLNAL